MRLHPSRRALAPLAALGGFLLVGCGDSDTGGGGGAGSTSHTTNATSTGGLEFEMIRGDAPYDTAPDASPDEVASVRDGQYTLATSLARLMRGEGNVLLSPYSIHMAFGQLYGGTSSDAQAEVEAAMGFAIGERTHVALSAIDQSLLARNHPGDDDRAPLVFTRGNSLFSDRVFAEQVFPTYLDLLSRHYDSAIRLVPFDTDPTLGVSQVNAWIGQETRGKIPELLPPGLGPVQFIVVHATYLYASFGDSFIHERTAAGSFLRANGESVTADIMEGVWSQPYAEGDTWEATSICYTRCQLELSVIVPKAGQLAAFEDALGGAALGEVFAALSSSSGHSVTLQMPSFDLRQKHDLIGPLSELGMSAIFAGGGLDRVPSSQSVGGVFHEVALAVDEDGTEGAAATAIVVSSPSSGSGIPPEQVTLVADRTFYVAVRDPATGALVFFARIDDPTG